MTTARRGQRANLQRHQKKHRKRKAHNATRVAARAREKSLPMYSTQMRSADVENAVEQMRETTGIPYRLLERGISS